MNHTPSPDLVAAVQTPSFDNQSPRAWDQYAKLAFYFARHARHDLANIHCALGMLEMVEQIQQDCPDMPLPEELNLDEIRIKSALDIKKVISISNALIMLSQAAATPAYQPATTQNLSQIIKQHICDQADTQELDTRELQAGVSQVRVLTMGDMLGAALATCFFQWTPWSQLHTQATQTTLTHHPRSISLRIPSDNLELLKQFTSQLNATSDDPLSIPLEQHLTTSTGTLALWLARHIIIIHGGVLDVDANALTVTLPTMN